MMQEFYRDFITDRNRFFRYTSLTEQPLLGKCPNHLLLLALYQKANQKGAYLWLREKL